MPAGIKNAEIPDVKISMNLRQGDPSLLDINDHLTPESTLKTK